MEFRAELISIQQASPGCCYDVGAAKLDSLCSLIAGQSASSLGCGGSPGPFLRSAVAQMVATNICYLPLCQLSQGIATDMQ